MIPGIGPINAVTILAEAGDLRRFGHHRQFLTFCGLDLATRQSVLFRGRTKLSKYGHARLRRTFWMATPVEIGSAAGRVRVCPYVQIAAYAVALPKITEDSKPSHS